MDKLEADTAGDTKLITGLMDVLKGLTSKVDKIGKNLNIDNNEA
jgi:hypothetical protein